MLMFSISPSFFSSLKLLLYVFFCQPCFADVEFPESNFVDQVELLMKDQEEKERFFQVCVFLKFYVSTLGFYRATFFFFFVLLKQC